jgi:hypothetical protein
MASISASILKQRVDEEAILASGGASRQYRKGLIRIVVGLAGFEPAITWVLGLYGSQAT